MDIKNVIAQSIAFEGKSIDFLPLITETQDKSNGDYTITCFSLAKIFKKSPVQIANEIKENFKQNKFIDKIEVVNGYVNLFVNRQNFIKEVLEELSSEKLFEKDPQNKEKTICVEYCSINLAKYMHIGHLSTTMIGESLARIFTELGYNTKRLNYVGDFGTPFGKMVYAFLEWGNEKELTRGVDYIQELYVKFCALAENDPSLEEKAREYFKKICEKEEPAYSIYQKFIEISKKENERLLDMMGVHFDSWKGESAYSDQLENVIKMLQDKKLLVESNGAKMVDLDEYGLGKCLVEKSDGTSLYATRDIAAAIDRYNTYHFEKMFYVTAVQQKLHFQQFFKVLELLGYQFSQNLTHVQYGMFSLPTGKIASRKGKQAVLVDLIDYALNKARSMVVDRSFDEKTQEVVAQKIAFSALRFSAIKNERIKDTVFDIENAFSFEGDTSAYIQYTYARMCSILRKVGDIDLTSIDFSYLNSEPVASVMIAVNKFQNVLTKSAEQSEPSIISKYTLDLCKLINKFYSQEKVLSTNLEMTKAKVFFLVSLQKLLLKLFNILCIDVLEEM